MLISPVLPLMSIYRLPHGQYRYGGHVINLSQDIPSFVSSFPRLPSDVDIVLQEKKVLIIIMTFVSEGQRCLHLYSGW